MTRAQTYTHRSDSISTRIRNRIRFSLRKRPDPGRKLRVLFLVGKYPEFSETYMHEEMVGVSQTCDISIVSYLVGEYPRARHLPYAEITYEDACINWGPFEYVNTEFTNEAQVDFLNRMAVVIDDFRPHVLHGHYFATGLLTKKLAELHGIPFTVRTHSFDMLMQKKDKMDALFNAARSPWCLGVFTFPAFRDRFVENGVPEAKAISAWPVVNVARFHRTEKPARTGRIMCAGPCVAKKAHRDFVELGVMMKDSGLEFTLYTKGHDADDIARESAALGNPISVVFCEPDEMQEVYRSHDWLVYTSDTEVRQVGLPAAIIEAQASGIGVCWQELPGRRQEQLDFLGGGGFLFESIRDVPETISREYPEEMRLRGLENAKKCDVSTHCEMLLQVWHQR